MATTGGASTAQSVDRLRYGGHLSREDAHVLQTVLASNSASEGAPPAAPPVDEQIEVAGGVQAEATKPPHVSAPSARVAALLDKNCSRDPTDRLSVAEVQVGPQLGIVWQPLRAGSSLPCGRNCSPSGKPLPLLTGNDGMPTPGAGGANDIGAHGCPASKLRRSRQMPGLVSELRPRDPNGPNLPQAALPLH